MEDKDIKVVKDRYEIADLKVVMTTYYERTRRQALPYTAKGEWTEDEADVNINLGQDYYEERKKSDDLKGVDYDAIEYVTTGSRFHRYLLDHDGLMLHSSAVVVDDWAYLFSADCGTGKSTHTQLWRRHFGDRAFIINDDKPTLRKMDGKWYVYGTPWSGKTDWNVNAKVRLGAIVFIERSKENHIEEISVSESIPIFFKQTIRKLPNEEKMDLSLSHMGDILTSTPTYRLGCDMSDEAVVTAYEKIKRTEDV